MFFLKYVVRVIGLEKGKSSWDFLSHSSILALSWIQD